LATDHSAITIKPDAAEKPRISTLIITSAMEAMFYPAFVCLFVSNYT